MEDRVISVQGYRLASFLVHAGAKLIRTEEGTYYCGRQLPKFTFLNDDIFKKALSDFDSLERLSFYYE